MSERPVAAVDDVPAGGCTLVEVEGARLVLARVGSEVYALGDACAHRGGPLHQGRLAGTRLTCPWHGWMYDVRTGQCLLPARGGPVPAYPVRVEAGRIFVDMP